MSYLRYVCLLGHSGSQHILCFCFAFVGVSCLIYVMRVCPPDIVFLVLFLFCFSSFCAPCVSSFYGLSIYLVGSVLLIFLVFLCCPIMYLYILSSVLWCPLRFPNRNDVQFVITFSCLEESSCLIYVICICLRKVVLLFLIGPSVFSGVYSITLDKHILLSLEIQTLMEEIKS